MAKKSIDEMLKFSRRGRPLTAARLAAAEEELGVTFPEDYRRFLLATNGGVPDPAFFVFGEARARAVSWVFRICSITTSRTDPTNLRGENALLARYAAEGTTAPAGCIAIGSCPNESLLLFTRGRRKGQVWLKCWDEAPTRTDEPDNPEAGMHRLATSFDRFLGLLCDEAEAERRRAGKRAGR